MPLADIDALASDASLAEAAGGKARVSAQLRARGLPTPGGFAVLPGPYEPRELKRRGGELAARLIARSSSAIEDDVAGVAPGVFATVADVEVADLERAVADVRASAESEVARAYALVKGLAHPAPMTVLVQPYLQAASSGTLYTRSSASSDDMVLEVAHRDGRRVRVIAARGGKLGELGLGAGHSAALLEHAVAIERLFEWPRGADIEWLIADDTLWIVQARPLSRYPRRARQAPPPEAFAFSPAESDLTWRWDVSHNPAPLSPPQRGLVERVKSELGIRLELACGYLYEADDAAPARSDASIAGGSDAGARLESLFFHQLGPRLDAIVAASEADPPGLAAALDVYLEINRAYAVELRPALRAARASAPAIIPSAIGVRLLRAIASAERGFSPATRAGAAAAAARGSAAYWAPYAARWDVAEPCFDEDPTSLAALAEHLDRLPPEAPRGPWLGALVHAVSELDDRLFYRGQRLVRRAILALPGSAATPRFELDLSLLLAWERDGAAPADADRQAAKNRAAHLAALDLEMPLEVRGGVPIALPSTAGRALLRGAGSGGRGVGVVTRGAAGRGQVLLAVDLTPGEIIRAARAEAIVLEGGSLLGHGAALARELGVPIVTQAVGSRDLAEGERIWVDGQAGIVVPDERSGG